MMGYESYRGITENEPRTIDLLTNTVMWLIGATVLNSLLIGMILWIMLR